jgi:hypothetical protein
MQKLLHIGALAKAVGEPLHRVDYAVERHGPEPLFLVSGMRAWSLDQVPQVRASLRKTKAQNRNQSCYA